MLRLTVRDRFLFPENRLEDVMTSVVWVWVSRAESVWIRSLLSLVPHLVTSP